MNDQTVGGLFLLAWVFIGGAACAEALYWRLRRRHPDVLKKLGPPVYTGPGGRGSRRHASRWWRFISREHYELDDPLLTNLCIASNVFGIVSILLVFLVPVWSPWVAWVVRRFTD